MAPRAFVNSKYLPLESYVPESENGGLLNVYTSSDFKFASFKDASPSPLASKSLHKSSIVPVPPRNNPMHPLLVIHAKVMLQ